MSKTFPFVALVLAISSFFLIHMSFPLLLCFTYSLHLVLIYSLFRWALPDLSTITQLHPLSKIHPVSLQLLALDLLYAIFPSLVAQMVKNLPAMRETQVWSLGQEDPLQKGMTAHSTILAWRITWTEKSGRLQSMGMQRVGHDWATNIFTFIYPSTPTRMQPPRGQGLCLAVKWSRSGVSDSLRPHRL